MNKPMTLHTLTEQALDEAIVFYGPSGQPVEKGIPLKKVCYTITRLLEAEIERLEGMKKIDSGKCPECGGDGYLVEADPSDQSGQTPMQVQCHACFATGVIEMPNLDYNKAIDDHITYLKAELAKIKEI